MSRRRGNGSGDRVIGPTSALTSFLKDHGITAPPRNPYGRRNRDADNSDEPSTSATPTVAPAASTSTLAPPMEVVQEEKEEEEEEKQEEEEITPKGKKRKASTSGRKPKKKKKEASDDEDEDADFVPKAPRYADRTPGSFSMCGDCGKKFTVTKYTVSDPSGALLCPQCGDESKASARGLGGPVPKPKIRRKAKIGKRGDEKEERRVPSLQEYCIKIVADNIDNVEMLGTISSVNLDNICKIVCKHRKLSDQVLKLFLFPERTQLALYDCTSLDAKTLTLIPAFSPHITSLVLNMCGQLTDEVLGFFMEKLQHLAHISLYGPHRISEEGWKAVFEGRGEQLRTFELRNSARFALPSVQVMVKLCPNIQVLRLSELTEMTDDCLTELEALENLTSLDISKSGKYQSGYNTSISSDAVISLLQAVGGQLESLNLGFNQSLTDEILTAIAEHCQSIRFLDLNNLIELTDEGFKNLFETWAKAGTPGLVDLNIARCLNFGSEAFEALRKQSAKHLMRLNMNSLDDLKEVDLKKIAGEAGMDREEVENFDRLEFLDVSFVRSVDDYLIKALLDNLTHIKIIRVYGCNRVTDLCPRRRGVLVKGQETSKEFDVY